MLPGGLSGIDWGVPPECSPPFLPAGLEGRFRSPSLSCAHCWKAALPWTCTWDLLGPGQTRRGGRGWLGAFLSRGSVATGPLFQKLLDLWSSGKEAWGLSGRHQPSRQHLIGAYTFPVTGSSRALSKKPLLPWDSLGPRKVWSLRVLHQNP